jgi:hypothetical protein
MIAAPEEILFESTAVGTFLVDVDLERVRLLRASRDSVEASREFAAKAGVLSEQWQRPHLYGAVHTTSPATAG